jgi:hypothetical protein
VVKIWFVSTARWMKPCRAGINMMTDPILICLLPPVIGGIGFKVRAKLLGISPPRICYHASMMTIKGDGHQSNAELLEVQRKQLEATDDLFHGGSPRH